MKLSNKFKIKIDKNLFVFLIVLLIVGVIAGSILVISLNKNDYELLNNHLLNFINNVKDNNLNYAMAFKSNLFTNLFFVGLIWLLGISVIGLPIMIFLFFVKAFSLGFIVAAIFKVLKLKGFLFGIIYVFPGQVINMLLYLFLLNYAMAFSIKMFHTIFYKKTLDFKIIMNTYLKMLLIVVIGIFIVSMYETYIMPKLINIFISYIL